MNCYIHATGNEICNDCKGKYLVNETIPSSWVQKLVHKIVSPFHKLQLSDKQKKESEYDLTKEKQNVEAAIANGCKIIVGDDFHLLLDFDNQASFMQYIKMNNMVNYKFGISNVEYWGSKSGANHLHYYITLKQPLDALSRIALQAILGSDPKRECFGVHKFLNGIKEPNMLFKPSASTASRDIF